MKTKPSIPIEKHMEMANRLRELHLDLKRLYVEAAEVFTMDGQRGDVWKELRKAETAVYLARVYAEKNYIEDVQEPDPSVYFPDQEPGPDWPNRGKVQ